MHSPADSRPGENCVLISCVHLVKSTINNSAHYHNARWQREESEQPASGSEPDVNRQDDEESEQPFARFEPDVNTQEVEGNEDSESNEDRNTDTEYSNATYPSLSTRATPYQLTQHLKKLNDAQSQSLRDMGFDHLREQQISRVPRKLAWWLLNNFDARSCSLRV
nr:hypothetical protein CTI12_AA434990 [Ipomoea trifida]